MGNKQPKKKGQGYEDRLSLEMVNLINETKTDIEKEYPSLYLTEHLFFLTALDIEGCFLYETLTALLPKKDIETLYDELKKKVESETLSVVKPGSTITYSDGFINLLTKANAESKALKQKTITSDHALMAFLHDDSNKGDILYEILAKKGITYDKVKEASKELADKITENIGENGKTTTVEPLNLLQDFISSISDDKAVTYTIGMDMGVDSPFTSINIASLYGNNDEVPEKKKNEGIEFCHELVSLSKKDTAKFIGKKNIIDSIINTMAKKKQSNIVLVGESGVGKTALIKHIAKSISDNELPEFFAKKIYSIDFSEIVAGTQFRGVFETRVKNLVDELEKQEDALVFIDNIQDIIISDSRSDDISGVLSSILNNENIKLIITTTTKGYKTMMDKYKSIAKKFQRINLEPSSISETAKILSGLKAEYEKFHNVKYPKDFAETFTSLAARYLNDKCLPVSAINLMDEVGALKKMTLLRSLNPIKKELFELEKKVKTKYGENKIEDINKSIEEKRDELAKSAKKLEKAAIDEDDIFTTVSKMSGIPTTKISLSEKMVLKTMDDSVKQIVIGQDEAIEKMCRIIKRNKMGLAPENKPIGSFLCIGGTGCGKTLIAKTIAKEVFGDEKYLVRFDMSEYSDETSVNKLIGSSAGYVGYSEGGLLTEAVKNRKYAVVLFDEIEKANEKVFNLFLQILDEGCLTDNMGEKVDFKNTIIIMTSNVGVKDATLNVGIGFNVDNKKNRKNIIEKSLKSKFAPEFLNRLNDIIYFNDLTDDNLKTIIKLETNKLVERLRKINLNGKYGNKTVDFIFEAIKGQKEYGARPITRAIQDNIENKITDMLLDNDYGKNYIFDFDKIIN